jgi:hypothetical protein
LHGRRKIRRQRRGHRFAVVLGRGAGIKFEAVDDRAELAAGSRNRFAVVAHLEHRKLLRSLADKLRHLINDFRTTRCSGRRPLAFERSTCRCDGVAYVLLRCFANGA